MLLSSDKQNDENLVLRIAQGDNEAFAILVRKHLSRFYYIAYKFTKSKEDAEDIVQNCFLKLWQSPQKFDAQKNVKFITWFSKVVSNEALDFLKKHKAQNLNEDFDIEDESKNQLELIEQEIEREELKLALKQLNENQRQAIKLTFLEEHKNQESAEIMGISLKAFQSLLMRSKKSLKLILQKNS